MSYKLTHDISCRLAKQLHLGLNHDGATLLEILKDLLRLSQGKSVDSKELVNLVIKLTQMKDYRIKKLVYLYLSFVTDDESDMWLQVMNSITNDLSEPSPVLKNSSLLLLTDSQCLSSTLSETRLSLITRSLKDSNNAVRRCATSGVTKFSALVRNHCEQIDISDTLEQVNKMIYGDDDPSVIIQCVYCLHSSGKFHVENLLILSLVERLGMVDMWTKAEIVNLFLQVVDRDKMTEDEIFHCLNVFDPYLDEKYPHYLSIICSCAMIFVTSKFSAIFKDVVHKVFDFLLSQLSLVPLYLQSVYFSILEALSCHLPKKVQLPFKVFTPLFMDNPFAKVMKIRLLCKSCTKENCSYIFKIVTSVMLTAEEWEVVQAAAESLINLHDHLPKDCEDFMTSMLSHESPVVFETNVTVLWRLVFSGCLDLKIGNDEICRLIEGYAKLRSLDGKTAYFSLISLLATESHGPTIAAVMLTELAKWDDNDSTAYKLLLLRHIHVYYFLSPTHFDDVLGSYVSKASRDANPLVCRQARVYYRMLKENTGKLKTYLDVVAKLRYLPSKKIYVDTDLDKVNGVCLLTVERKRFK